MKFCLLKYAHIADIDSGDEEEEREEAADDSRAVELRHHRYRLNGRAKPMLQYPCRPARSLARSPRPPVFFPSTTASQICVSSLDRPSVRPSVVSLPIYLLLERPTSNGMEL